MQIADDYRSIRPYLLAVAYNITGRVQEAEDIVQDAFEDLITSPPTHVRSLKSYLTRIVVNKSIDRINALKRQRDSYPGIWLPEPYIIESDNDVNADVLPYAILHALESLNPVERAVVILREAFNYSYEDIAEICDVTTENCRQILHRAKPKLKGNLRPATVDPKIELLMKEFLNASLTQDTSKLSQLLRQDVVLYSDGGGKVIAARRVLDGLAAVGKFMLGIIRKAMGIWSEAKVVNVNGQPGLLVSDANAVYVVVMFGIHDDKITEIFLMRNPEKIFYKNLSQNSALPDLDAN